MLASRVLGSPDTKKTTSAAYLYLYLWMSGTVFISNFGCPTLCPVCSWTHWLTQLWRQILVVCSMARPRSVWLKKFRRIVGGSSWFLARSSDTSGGQCQFSKTSAPGSVLYSSKNWGYDVGRGKLSGGGGWQRPHDNDIDASNVQSRPRVMLPT